MENRYIATSFFDIYLEYLSVNKYDADDIKKEISSVKKNYPHRAPEEKFLFIYHLIAERFPKHALAFRIGVAAQAKHYGVVGYMASTCATLQQALIRCMPYQSLFENTIDAKLNDLGDSIKLAWWGEDADIDRVLCEMGLAAFLSFYQMLIGKHIPPICMELPFAAGADPNIYEAIVGCPVIFDSDCVSITLQKSVLFQDISTNDPYLRSLYERQAKALLDADKPDDTFLKEVRKAIQTQLFESSSSAEAVSEKLGMSLRSFYRKLNQYDIRYRSLLADTRLSLAQAYLADPSLSLAEISLMLGYSDQSAFTRAFVSWTGVSPSKYRAS